MADGNSEQQAGALGDETPFVDDPSDDDTTRAVKAASIVADRRNKRRYQELNREFDRRFTETDQRLGERLAGIENAIRERLDDTDRRQDQRIEALEAVVREQVSVAVTRVTEAQDVMGRPRHTLEELIRVASEAVENNDPVT